MLVLDSLEDPQNVGTLLRSAEAAGVHGVIFPTHRQAPLTPAAIKASAGAVEHLLLCPVDDLPGAMSDLRVRGLRIAAAEADAPLTAAQADLRGPLAIVVGSEGQGLSPAVRRRSDVAVRIPMRGAIGSLNASVAGSILLFVAVAQRDPAGLGDKPARPVGAEAWPVRSEPEVAPADEATGSVGKAKKARGQSVVADEASDAAVTESGDASTMEIKPSRRRTAVKAAATPQATAELPPTPAPKARAVRKAVVDNDAVAETAPQAAKHASPRAVKRAARTAASEGAAKPVRGRSASTKRAPGTAKATAPAEDATTAAEASPDGDELLPGGPEPT